MRRKLLLAVTLLVTGQIIDSSAAAPASAAGPGMPAADDKASIRAIRVKIAPRLDGDILDDPAWREAPAVSQFWQTTPDEGAAASQRTEIRIVYTSDTLYVGAICYDQNPDKIIVSDARRDASLDETDCLQFILDTYHDRQNGFVFGTNPAGIEYDGQVVNEGQGGRFGNRRQRSGSGGGFNINWDGSWDVRTKITEIGWCAEFAIPFRTLRFSKKAKQIWGINFQRNIRRRNETAFWAKLPRQYNLFRLSLAGELRGLELRTPKNLQFMPYLLGEGAKNFTKGAGADWDGDAGVDVKYSLTPSLTLDATYNTDFAQVEVDEQQINFDRFNLFFPEKRPFFLENAGLFSVGSTGEVELFFSRRIGIFEGGRVPIAGGGRISGKVSGLSLGLLNLQTGAVPDLTQANNFTVARLFTEMPNRSAIGAIFINRQGTGHLAPDDDYNRTFGFDARLGLGQNMTLSGFAAKTSTPFLSGRDHAFKLGFDYNAQAWLLGLNYTEVGEDFNPEVGFLSRARTREINDSLSVNTAAFRKLDFLIFNRSRMKGWLGLHELRPHVSYRGFWNFAGFQETGFLHMDNHWEWQNGYELHTGINFTKEGVVDSFAIAGVDVSPGTYDHVETQIVGMTNQGASASFRTRITAGGFFGGRRFAASNTFKLRFGETLTTEFNYNFNRLTLPNGEVNTNLLRLRVSYSFTPRIYLQSLVQYNDSQDIWATNLRFGWLQSANTGLFIVYNETQDILGGRFTLNNRSFIVKYSRLLDILN